MENDKVMLPSAHIAAFLKTHVHVWELAKATDIILGKTRLIPIIDDDTDIAVLFGAADSFSASRTFSLDHFHAGLSEFFHTHIDHDAMMAATLRIAEDERFTRIIESSFDAVRNILLRFASTSEAYFGLLDVIREENSRNCIRANLA